MIVERKLILQRAKLIITTKNNYKTMYVCAVPYCHFLRPDIYRDGQIDDLTRDYPSIHRPKININKNKVGCNFVNIIA